MKTKWVLLLFVAVLTINTSVLYPRPVGRSMIGVPGWEIQQEATPQPGEATFDEVTAPRPPSEAGQNMVLIIGAAMLVMIVFVGVALHARQQKQPAAKSDDGSLKAQV